MKKTLSLFTAIVLLMTAAVAVAAQTTDLQALAGEYVPLDAVFQRTERDDGLMEYHFSAPDHSVEYDVSIDPALQCVVRVEYDVRNDRGSSNVVLTAQQAQDAVLALYPEGTIASVTLERDDNRQKYEVLFGTPDFAGKAEVDPETGAVLDRDLDYTRAGDGLTAAGPLTAEQAKALVLEKVPNGRIVSFEKDRDNGREVYEGEAVADGREYEFEIDAATGAMIKWEMDD